MQFAGSSVRNSTSPEIDFMKTIGYLKKDRMESVSRRWLVNAWRIVDANGVDLIQPWDRTKSEARVTAKHCNIELKGELK